MREQNFVLKNDKIRSAFEQLKREHPDRLRNRLNLSWSNWGFGMESLANSAARLARAGVTFIELHGNQYGDDLGYKVDDTRKVLVDHGLTVAGLCGMFTPDNDLSSNRATVRQEAIDYLKRVVPFAAAVGAGYVLTVPGAVGRPAACDDTEFERSVETLRRVADLFVQHKVKAAVEPIRSDEVSLCHTIADAKRYIQAVDHPGVKHINGDVYHMQTEESHIPTAVLEAGDMLTNLHVADSNRRALGDGSLDLDTLIMALYVIGYNRPGCFVTPEPLGPGGDPYPAMHGKPDGETLDRLVTQTVTYFRERESCVVEG